MIDIENGFGLYTLKDFLEVCDRVGTSTSCCVKLVVSEDGKLISDSGFCSGNFKFTITRPLAYVVTAYSLDTLGAFFYNDDPENRSITFYILANEHDALEMYKYHYEILARLTNAVTQRCSNEMQEAKIKVEDRFFNALIPSNSCKFYPQNKTATTRVVVRVLQKVLYFLENPKNKKTARDYIERYK